MAGPAPKGLVPPSGDADVIPVTSATVLAVEGTPAPVVSHRLAGVGRVRPDDAPTGPTAYAFLVALAGPVRPRVPVDGSRRPLVGRAVAPFPVGLASPPVAVDVVTGRPPIPPANVVGVPVRVAVPARPVVIGPVVPPNIPHVGRANLAPEITTPDVAQVGVDARDGPADVPVGPAPPRDTEVVVGVETPGVPGTVLTSDRPFGPVTATVAGLADIVAGGVPD